MHVIIPARYASSRLPGKPLLDIAGKPMIQRVHECAMRSGAQAVIIATDDERVRRAAEGFGARVVMTQATHRSGTDRLAEAIEKLAIPAEAVVVNLQGDEPLMPPALIREVADKLSSSEGAPVATVCHAIHDRDTLVNPNVVKVVCNAQGHAMYFSRAAIPWPRETMAGKGKGKIQAMHHIGLYAYRAGFVRRYASWPVCPPEEAEQLEQLRVLWHGERIVVLETDHLPGPGVDTPEDLERVRKIFLNRQD